MSVCYSQPFIQAQLLLNAPSALIYNNSALCAYNVFVFCMIITIEWLFQNSSKWLVALIGGCYSGVAKVVLLQSVAVPGSCYCGAATDTTVMWSCSVGNSFLMFCMIVVPAPWGLAKALHCCETSETTHPKTQHFKPEDSNSPKWSAFTVMYELKYYASEAVLQ